MIPDLPHLSSRPGDAQGSGQHQIGELPDPADSSYRPDAPDSSIANQLSAEGAGEVAGIIVLELSAVARRRIRQTKSKYPSAADGPKSHH